MFGKNEEEFCVRQERNTCEYSGIFALGPARLNAGSPLQYKNVSEQGWNSATNHCSLLFVSVDGL
jgi:hypothetical protein